MRLQGTSQNILDILNQPMDFYLPMVPADTLGHRHASGLQAAPPNAGPNTTDQSQAHAESSTERFLRNTPLGCKPDVKVHKIGFPKDPTPTQRAIIENMKNPSLQFTPFITGFQDFIHQNSEYKLLSSVDISLGAYTDPRVDATFPKNDLDALARVKELYEAIIDYNEVEGYGPDATDAAKKRHIKQNLKTEANQYSMQQMCWWILVSWGFSPRCMEKVC